MLFDNPSVIDLIRRSPRPEAESFQLSPLLVETYMPESSVPAKIVEGLRYARVVMLADVNPLVSCDQLAPKSVDRNNPERSVPAYTCPAPLIVIARTRSSGKLLLMAAQFVPASVERNIPWLVPAYR